MSICSPRFKFQTTSNSTSCMPFSGTEIPTTCTKLFLGKGLFSSISGAKFGWIIFAYCAPFITVIISHLCHWEFQVYDLYKKQVDYLASDAALVMSWIASCCTSWQISVYETFFQKKKEIFNALSLVFMHTKAISWQRAIYGYGRTKKSNFSFEHEEMLCFRCCAISCKILHAQLCT